MIILMWQLQLYKKNRHKDKSFELHTNNSAT